MFTHTRTQELLQGMAVLWEEELLHVGCYQAEADRKGSKNVPLKFCIFQFTFVQNENSIHE